MGEVIEICRADKKEFTWAEANALLPLVKRIFERHLKTINKQLSEQRYYVKSNAPKHVLDKCDDLISEEMSILGNKITKLGGKILGNGYIGFDSGIFYWSFNGQFDKELNHYHDYTEDPTRRREITILYPQVVVE